MSVKKYDDADPPVEVVDYPFTSYETDKRWEGDDEDYELETPRLKFLSQTNNREDIYASTGEDGDLAIQSVNELYEVYNAPLVNNNLWNLNTAVNGGFRITMSKTTKLGRLQIDGEFARALGLVPTLKCASVDKLSDQVQISDRYVLVQVDAADPGSSHLNGQEFENYCVEGQLSDYVEHNTETGEKTVIAEDTSLETLKGKTIYDKRTLLPYRVIDKVTESFRNRRVYVQTVDAEVSYRGEGGRELWTFEDPPLGSWVMNNGQVSPQTFSLFEGLVVTLPTLPFQSQEVSYATGGERALLELRFPVEAQTSHDNTGQVTGTSMSLMGDVIWNRTGQQQYLPISSIGDIYQMNARISLVYRNAAGRPPLPVYLAPGGLWQLKVLLLEAK